VQHHEIEITNVEPFTVVVGNPVAKLVRDLRKENTRQRHQIKALRAELEALRSRVDDRSA
jgi:hypothetical protein